MARITQYTHWSKIAYLAHKRYIQRIYVPPSVGYGMAQSAQLGSLVSCYC